MLPFLPVFIHILPIPLSLAPSSSTVSSINGVTGYPRSDYLLFLQRMAFMLKSLIAADQLTIRAFPEYMICTRVKHIPDPHCPYLRYVHCFLALASSPSSQQTKGPRFARDGLYLAVLVDIFATVSYITRVYL